MLEAFKPWFKKLRSCAWYIKINKKHSRNKRILHKMTVELGFVEFCKSWRLESRFFPSKIGGKPAWLDLKNIPGEKDLQCDYCKEPCIFLCQIYAPYKNDDAFHRTIFIFICKKFECCKMNQNGNLKVFRSQLPKVNNFYPPEPPVEQKAWRPDISVNQWVKTCYICGILALNQCSKCKSINYCSRAHQVYHWKYGHKQSCATNKEIKYNNLLFPEYEIVIEGEYMGSDDDTDILSEEEEEEEIEKYETMVENDEARTSQEEDVQNELLNMIHQKEDKTFSKFKSIVNKYPDQILRYNRGGEILCISMETKIGEIPKCSECNGDRQFEFQIMPQLLNYLDFEDSLKCIDWGTLAVFTCINSCVPKNGYSVEHIWKQDITESNSTFN